MKKTISSAIFFIISSLILFCCLICFAIGCTMVYSHIVFFKHATIVPGTLVRYEQNLERNTTSHKESISYTAVVSYTFNGRTKEIKSSFSASSPHLTDIGKTLKVGINPKNTEDVRVKPGWNEFLFVVAFMAGSLIFGVSFFIFRYISRISDHRDTKNISSILSLVYFSLFFINRHERTIKNTIMCLAILIPLVAGGIIACLSYSHITFFKNAIIVPGTVEYRNAYQESASDSETMITKYQDIVSYSFNGETYKIINNSPANVKIYQVGVNPNNPYQARIYSKEDFVITIVITAFIGIFLSVFLCLLLIKFTKAQKQISSWLENSFSEGQV